MPNDPRPDADDLWRFALDFYAGPGTAAACLALQDEYTVDVVLLIGLLWLSMRNGRRLTAPEIASLDAVLADWRGSVVAPLRQLRRALKPRLDALPATAAETRNRIKDAELSAERVAVDLLADAMTELPAADSAPDRRIAAHDAVEAYLAWLGCPPTPALSALTGTVLKGLPRI